MINKLIKGTKLASEFCSDVSLKSIRHNRISSHDTHHFSAQVCLNGKKIMRVQNDGRGGDNYYNLSRSSTPTQVLEVSRQAKSFCKRARKKDYDRILKEGSNTFSFIDLLVGSLANEQLTRDEMRKQLRKRMYVIEGSAVGNALLYGIAKRASPINVKKIKEIEPELTIVNEFDEETQLKLWLTIN